MSDGSAPDVRWSVELPHSGGGWLAVVADGLLVGGPGWLGLCAFTGGWVWQTEVPPGVTGGAALLDEHLIARMEQEQVVIRDCLTGMIRHRWEAPDSSWLVETPWGDVLLFQARTFDDRAVRCITRDGRARWEVPMSNAPVDYPPTPFAVGDLMVIDHGGALRAYDRAGVLQWVARHDAIRTPADDDGERIQLTELARIDRSRVLAGLMWDEGSGLFEIDGRGPSVRQIGDAPFVVKSPIRVRTGPGDDYLIAGARGQIDIGHMDYVYPLRVVRPDGSTVWEHQLSAEFTNLDVMPDGGYVVSGSPTAKVWREYGQWQDLSDRTYARLIDAAGAEVWTWYAPGLVTPAAVAGPDGTVYVGSEGRLYALVISESGQAGAAVAEATPEPPLARTSHEANLYLDLTPCECGEGRLPRTSAVIELPDGRLGSRYTGVCPSCGTERTYVFRLPDISQDVSTDDEIVYGLGDQPSELLDPAQWLLVADRYAGAVPAQSEGLRGDARRIAKTRLMAASAAVYEAEKFLPDLAERIPADRIRSDIGRRWLVQEPGRFDAARMAMRRETYERALREITSPARPVFDPERVRRLETPGDGMDRASGQYLDSAAGALVAFQQLRDAIVTGWAADPAERDRRLFRVTETYDAWRTRHGIDDSGWPQDPWAIPADARPPAGLAWEMVRAARGAAGLDPATRS
jgi:hypothetical protein